MCIRDRRCNVHERVDHRTLEAQREEALDLAYAAERNGDERAHVAEIGRAVELDRPPLPDVGARGWSMMRRGIATPASDRWHEVREIGLQVREVAREFQSSAREWLERALDRVQERTAALGLTRAPETALERLQAARASRGAEERPQTALERLQAAREGRGEDRSAEIERNVESAGADLTEQDRERQRVLEQERAIERQWVAEREGPDYSI